tara:strand:+ start:394 stop:1146 length:753 start_codon:yes stop_codon:yes gene_type:complete
LSKKNKIRLDELLVKREISKNLDHARRDIWAGKIKLLNSDYRVLVPHAIVDVDSKFQFISPEKFVSRGGYKLDSVLDDFAIDVSGFSVLDVGSSTGGFTDCVIQRNAKIVYSVDVGKGQLAWKLRNNPKVFPIEGLNARHKFTLPNDDLVDLIVIDVSFISAKLIIDNCLNFLKDNGFVIVLIKPQFESEKSDIVYGGVIKDPVIHAKVLADFLTWTLSKNVTIVDLKKSKLLGLKGNQEYFLCLKKNKV